ncbi:MAG: 1,2-phenylacetyl-CoA epoxidase subunit PaaD [Woeseiaceae bacterium]
MVVQDISREQVLAWLSEVPDPEIPVLTITDLGIVRDVTVNGEVVVALTPTYTGCPATEVIEQSVVSALQAHGVDNVSIDRVLSPPWTTDWISEEGRDKLREYGIAPPDKGGSKRELLHGERQVACPRCSSTQTSLVSEFGSTACKASYKCAECLEPFEYFKCI